MEIFLFSLFLFSIVQSRLLQRDSPETYFASVCTPNITVSAGTVIPPCISVTTIEEQCRPNGTSPLDYLAHAECMCSPPSTYFADWAGCLNCLSVHGAHSQEDANKFSIIMSSASSELCTGTPTAEFESIFSTVADTVPDATSGATILSDQFPSQSAVSLYYTPPTIQGPGLITGWSNLYL
jgi:hypothetical protein